MPRIPQYKHLTNNSVDVLNAIRNSSSTNYRDYVPVAHDGSDIRQIGSIIMDSPSLQNQFLNSLVNRIGLVLMANREYQNPWKMFKRGELTYGETVQEIFVDLATPHQFDQEIAETQLYRRELPDVRAAYHVINSKIFYKTTISRKELNHAFLSENGVFELVEKIVESLYNASEYDEFLIMKYLLAKNAVNGRVTPVAIPNIETANMNEIVGAIKGTSNAFEFMSTRYNTAGVRNLSKKDNQYLILNAKFDAKMDVEVLASAFNMDKADFVGHRVLVDSFANTDEQRLEEIFNAPGNEDVAYEPLTDEELAILEDVPAILVDKDYFMILDNNKQMTDRFNEQGLYWNYWYHTWRVFSVSPFANNALFVEGTPVVNSITVTPNELTTGAGTKVMLSADVNVTSFAPKTVDWTTDNELATVDAGGTLTLDPEIPSATVVEVTATSTFDDTKVATATITIA